MHFNVSQLMKEPSGSDRSFGVDEELSPNENLERQRVRGTVELLRTDGGVWVSAELDTEAASTCSRCLEKYSQSIHVIVEEEFFSPAGSPTVSGLDVGEESFRIDHNHILDLGEPVRQYVALSAPMKLLCRRDCKGICLSCGANLNETSCQCDDAKRDSRWGPLLELVPSNGSTERDEH